MYPEKKKKIKMIIIARLLFVAAPPTERETPGGLEGADEEIYYIALSI